MARKKIEKPAEIIPASIQDQPNLKNPNGASHTKVCIRSIGIFYGFVLNCSLCPDAICTIITSQNMDKFVLRTMSLHRKKKKSAK